MNKAAIWFWLSCKRYLKRLPFLAVLLLLPLGAMVIRRAEKKGDEKIQIAVCSLDQEAVWAAAWQTAWPAAHPPKRKACSSSTCAVIRSR